MEIVGNVGKTNNFHDWVRKMLAKPTIPTISMNFEKPRETEPWFGQSWKLLEMLVKPTFSMICLWEIIENVGKTNIFHDWLTENVGKTNNSNNFHEFRAIVPKILEIVGNVSKTNIFHDLSVGKHGNCW